MDFLCDLARLAIAEPVARRDALLTLLGEIGCPVVRARALWGDHQLENIGVRFHAGSPQRVVVGAHYDCVPGSTGANDNGAAVCVLLAWLRGALRQPPPVPLDVVFFDLEERAQAGSRAYVAGAIPEDLLAMVNLDICGVGDTLIVAPGLDVQGSPLGEALRRANRLARVPYRLVDAMPPGDHLPFEEAGVPTIAAGMLPAGDVAPFSAAIGAMRRGRPAALPPGIAETLHNGPRDAIAAIEADAVRTTLRWLECLIAELSGLYGR